MSRTDARSSSLRRRPSRTVPAGIVAAALTGAGVAGVWATVVRLSDGSWPGWVGSVHHWARTTTWDAPAVIAGSVLVALVGLWLLVLALRPGMPNAYEIAAGDRGGDGSTPETELVMTRRSVAELATAAAERVDAVESVSATVTARRVNLTVRTASAQAAQIERTVTDRVLEALGPVGLTPVPKVTTRVRTRQP